MQRNPSHFGSYCQSSPMGISSTDFPSIGGNGGLIGKGMTVLRLASAPLADSKSQFTSIKISYKPPLYRRVPRISPRLEFRRTRSMQDRAGNGNVIQFLAIGGAAEQ